MYIPTYEFHNTLESMPSMVSSRVFHLEELSPSTTSSPKSSPSFASASSRLGVSRDSAESSSSAGPACSATAMGRGRLAVAPGSAVDAALERVGAAAADFAGAAAGGAAGPL